MIGRVGEENAGTISVERQIAKSSGKVAVGRRTAIRHADNLQALYVDALVLEHANARRSDCVEIFAVVSELLVIAGDEVDAVRRGQSAQRLSSFASVDGGAVEQIAGDEDQVGLLLGDLRHQACEEIAIANVSQVNVGQQRGFAAAPRVRKIRQTNSSTRDARPVRVPDAVQSQSEANREQHFDQ